MMKQKIYKNTFEECNKNINGRVCPRCGKIVEPIETVDNSNNPTYWLGCTADTCNLFTHGVDVKVFNAANSITSKWNYLETEDRLNRTRTLCENFLEMMLYYKVENNESDQKLIKDLVKLLKMAKCPDCDGSGIVITKTRDRQYVSRDMAIDAGDRALEGALCQDEEFDYCQCQWCYEKKAIIAAAEKRSKE